MFKRSLAIFVCISLLGVTAAPASWLPCCCKSKAKAGHVEKSGLSCCAKKAQSASPGTLTAIHTCCSAKANQTASCAKMALKKACPGCRCLEQMQIVALSGQSSQDSSAPVASFSTDTVSLIPVEAGVSESLLTFSAPPGMSTLLRTCTLRC